MSEFKNTIDVNKFRATNQPWNYLKLNSPWSIGYVTSLIESKIFKTKEDWEDFYFQSGAVRDNLISKLPQNEQAICNNHAKVDTYNKLPTNIKNINTHNGRTKEQFKEKAKILYTHLLSIGINNISVDECYECIRFRVICETWNGVILREHKTIENLKTNYLRQIDFKKVSGEDDYKFAVDYELYKNGVLICAIQIKPISYTWNTPYINNARPANVKKNLDYTNLNKVPVFNIYSKRDGEIEGISIADIEKIKKI